jgi:hypothetical protein
MINLVLTAENLDEVYKGVLGDDTEKCAILFANIL